MEKSHTIGFVGGGMMAEALIKGVLQAGLLTADAIAVADPDAGRRQVLAEAYGVAVHEDGREVCRAADIVILAVKPQVMSGVLAGLKSELGSRHLVISIAAGIPLALLERGLEGSGCRVIRVMPNTPAIVQEAATAISGGTGVGAEDLAMAQRIFDAVGSSVVVDESALDAVTGLSGSGPAYVFTFLEALIDAGLKVGLSRPVASELACQTVLGAVRLAMETNEHPAQLRAMVTSPGGTTIAALHAMERAGFRGVVIDAVEAATERSRELGRQVLASDRQ